jgi:hypothetical protein
MPQPQRPRGLLRQRLVVHHRHLCVAHEGRGALAAAHGLCALRPRGTIVNDSIVGRDAVQPQNEAINPGELRHVGGRLARSRSPSIGEIAPRRRESTRLDIPFGGGRAAPAPAPPPVLPQCPRPLPLPVPGAPCRPPRRHCRWQEALGCPRHRCRPGRPRPPPAVRVPIPPTPAGRAPTARLAKAMVQAMAAGRRQLGVGRRRPRREERPPRRAQPPAGLRLWVRRWLCLAKESTAGTVRFTCTQKAHGR